MVIVLPLESQPLLVTMLSGLLMIGFCVWFGRHFFQGLKHLCQSNSDKLPTVTLLIFAAVILLEFFFIVYFLNKDITSAPPYSFVYYPAICALICASISNNYKLRANVKIIEIILLFSYIISIFVINNLGLKKPFEPEKVAQIMNQDSEKPLMLVTAYSNY